jgi:hypothetical protein
MEESIKRAAPKEKEKVKFSVPKGFSTPIEKVEG